jgi:hypothetical protein
LKFLNDRNRPDGEERNERREAENRLLRISRENDEREEGRIQSWLDLAKKMFDDRDDDPTPSAA